MSKNRKLKKEDINKNNKRKIPQKSREKFGLKLTVYLILRFLVILCMVAQSMHGNWNNVLLCILTLILFTIPNFISNKFQIELPDTLEIIVYLFIFSSEILGEIQNFYGTFPHWDTMLHTLNGFLCAAIGFSLVDILNTTNSRITMTPSFVALVAFSFSMTVGVMWEFGEFAMDRYFYKDMQKDTIVNRVSSVKINKSGENIPITLNGITKTEIYSDNGKIITIIDNGYLDVGLIDTMKDLFVNFIGAVVFCILGYLYIKNRDGYKFLEGFISKKKSKVE